MNQPIVFVGGIHGVGKTTISRQLAELLGAGHVTAGALIRETADPGTTVTVGAGNKAVPHVDDNQTLLLRGLESYRARNGHTARPLLLDGHFSLLDPNGDVVEVPVEVFAAIGPVAVLLIEATHATVHRRLVERDAEAPSPERISALAHRERARATEVSVFLKVPMWIVSGEEAPEREAARAATHLRPLLVGGAA